MDTQNFQTDSAAYEPPYADMVNDQSFPVAGIVIIVVIAIIVLASISSSIYLIMTSFRVQRRSLGTAWTPFQSSRFNICGGLDEMAPPAPLPSYEDAVRMGATVPTPKGETPSRPPSYGHGLDLQGISTADCSANHPQVRPVHPALCTPLRIVIEDENSVVDQRQQQSEHRTSPVRNDSRAIDQQNKSIATSSPSTSQSTHRVAAQLSAKLHNLINGKQQRSMVTTTRKEEADMVDVPL